MKKNLRTGLLAAFVLSASSLSALVAGCESGDSYSISVSPNYAKLRPGQSVTLVASGWSDYKWTLEPESGAHLSGLVRSRSGDYRIQDALTVEQVLALLA